ncbi:DUF420 domain-containing protein [Candidatus Magnetaquicoccus inordinatus]|uniref:DUF420 domain-containing protein n=1 Tax=Candidatus Magnetaquicoccus inordinatus TaxID=2496818 RepID=UPI00102C0BF9|nr:DUF420 domain-containing protein [Candidatus Magnetaquicoccus inordinatus]
MISLMPHWNTFLNLLSLNLALMGFFAIRAAQEQRHKKWMIAAIVTATLFLLSYLIYHAQQGITPFPGQGAIRTFYFSLLIIHGLTAVITGILLPFTLYYALRQRRDIHKKWAKWTLLIWIFASLSGLLVYLMVYHWQP